MARRAGMAETAKKLARADMLRALGGQDQRRPKSTKAPRKGLRRVGGWRSRALCPMRGRRGVPVALRPRRERNPRASRRAATHDAADCPLPKASALRSCEGGAGDPAGSCRGVCAHLAEYGFGRRGAG